MDVKEHDELPDESRQLKSNHARPKTTIRPHRTFPRGWWHEYDWPAGPTSSCCGTAKRLLYPSQPPTSEPVQCSSPEHYLEPSRLSERQVVEIQRAPDRPEQASTRTAASPAAVGTATPTQQPESEREGPKGYDPGRLSSSSGSDQ